MAEIYLGYYQSRSLSASYDGDEITLRWSTIDNSDDVIKMDSKTLFKLLGFIAQQPGNEGCAT